MKKIIVAFDGSHFSEGTFRFLVNINSKEQILATGIFLPQAEFAELLYSFGGLTAPVYYQNFSPDDTLLVQKNIDIFKTRCEQNGIEYRVHPHMDMHVISQLLSETRFADLLLLSSELFYANLGEGDQEIYLRDVLHKSECPVMLIPEHFTEIENVVLAYDGTPSSVYAIKQFIYLLPEFTTLKTLLVSAGTAVEGETGITNIEEFAARHFSDLTIVELDIDPVKYFNAWLQNSGKSLLVTGAYGRPAISEMLRKSFVAEAIHDHKLPIFIAHK